MKTEALERRWTSACTLQETLLWIAFWGWTAYNADDSWVCWCKKKLLQGGKGVRVIHSSLYFPYIHIQVKYQGCRNGCSYCKNMSKLQMSNI